MTYLCNLREILLSDTQPLPGKRSGVEVEAEETQHAVTSRKSDNCLPVCHATLEDCDAIPQCCRLIMAYPGISIRMHKTIQRRISRVEDRLNIYCP